MAASHATTFSSSVALVAASSTTIDGRRRFDRQDPCDISVHRAWVALIVNEFCLLISRGAPVRLAVNESDASASFVAQATSTQRGFLQAVVVDRLRFGDFVGMDLMLSQWERYSLYHSAIDWRMESLDVIQPVESRDLTAAAECDDDGPLVVSITATLRVQFSQRTIENVFPHVMGHRALTRLLI
ncbi:unnamed protein product [Hyaloperonospora brassicae]|uniref:Uncharacterized protein n=1 Tax=Hyaloperonospora brassicae TaxID=162125 RepID=A0AAV0T056_HYABA|nr:unnamed protein product [Hyaloperonospora brassicae]